MNQKQFLDTGRYLIDDVKERSKKGDKHFFDADAMRFFSSRISELAWQKGNDIYFITSEADKGYIKHKGSIRAYTVRKSTIEGNIDKVSEFQEHATLRQARNHIKEILENDQ